MCTPMHSLRTPSIHYPECILRQHSSSKPSLLVGEVLVQAEVEFSDAIIGYPQAMESERKDHEEVQKRTDAVQSTELFGQRLHLRRRL